jgi:hypothetical protein
MGTTKRVDAAEGSCYGPRAIYLWSTDKRAVDAVESHAYGKRAASKLGIYAGMILAII